VAPTNNPIETVNIYNNDFEFDEKSSFGTHETVFLDELALEITTIGNIRRLDETAHNRNDIWFLTTFPM
jgi:hypothetical protein